ncbi:ABC transporter, ATP-binding protein [Synechococcus sp. PCC 7335]|uniref:ABC transporter ATP-binding protein n=1 Tax=Synechococcus sp. (strain ATCC 29403 / PCC 7335) TaxID=91464 RepID=UPI00017EE01C|nr:ABC transporter ATP-binding protein [Synechococcus sp. PCC 7335]EDX83832.1 ABC transporter, ATP-binding protein [Synechococcus sp. PCC 7335]
MIEVEKLSKAYGSTLAIKDVTFEVAPGEILGFLGPNGAGKTTTMRILTGYLPATGGTARVAGKDVHTESMAVRQRIGYLPEAPPLYPEMTVEGFLHFVARIKGMSAGDRPSKVSSAIVRCNLEEKRQVMIRKLSKGFKQRVGIAQAIVHNPPVIVLDEPTVGLDPKQIIDVRNLIKSLAGEHTIILSTHILPEVSMTCDRITIINQGEIIATDSPEHLVERLTGRGGYWVEIAGDIDAGLAALRSVPGVVNAEITASEGLAAGHSRFQVTTGSEDVGSAIAAQVVEQGLGLFELTRNRASLEDVFINLTTQEAAQAEESAELDIEQTTTFEAKSSEAKSSKAEPAADTE